MYNLFIFSDIQSINIRKIDFLFLDIFSDEGGGRTFKKKFDFIFDFFLKQKLKNKSF